MCIWLILVITLHITEAYLPGNARRVNSCPEPNNLTAWKIAARKLNCSEYIEANIRKGNLYHCLPSNFLNETIKFCGRFTVIGKGECPVYNYQNGATVATGRSCEHFTSGCPEPEKPPYDSLQFYKYSECFNINRIDRCYHAEPGCSNVEHRHETTSLHHVNRFSESNVSGSAHSESSVSGYETTPTTRSGRDVSSNSNLPGWVFVVMSVLVILVIVLSIIVIYHRKTEKNRIPVVDLLECKIEDNASKPLLPPGTHEANTNHCEETNISAKDPLLEKSLRTETNTNLLECKTEDNGSAQLLPPGTHEAKRNHCEETNISAKDPLLEKSLRTETNTSDNSEDKKKDHEKEPNKDNDGTIKETQIYHSFTVPKSRNVSNADTITPVKDPIPTEEEDDGGELDYNAFYYQLGEDIIKRELIKRFKRLLKDHTDKNTPTDDRDLLDHWDEKYKFYFNMWHLQELLHICKADDLFERCQKFAVEHGKRRKLYYFERTTCTTDSDREVLEVYTSCCLDDKCVSSKMEKIRETLGKHLEYKPDQIRLIDIKRGSLKFVFSLPEVTIQNLIDLHQRSGIWSIEVDKIETSCYIIKSDSGLQKKTSGLPIKLQNPTKCCQNSCPQEKKTSNERTRLLMQRNKGTGSWIAESNIQGQVLIFLFCKDVRSSSILKHNVHICIQVLVQNMYRSLRRLGSSGQVYEKQATMEMIPQTPRVSRKKAQKGVKYHGFLHSKVLEEMEPNVFLGILKTQYPMYYEDFEKAARRGNCRKERAENIANHLEGMKGKQFKDLQNSIIETFNSEKGNTDDALRIEKVKRKISSQWKDLVDEIDSTVINDTMEKLGLSKELFNASSGKTRRDRVTAFLEFVLGNEDYLLPFDGILHKHGLCNQ